MMSSGEERRNDSFINMHPSRHRLPEADSEIAAMAASEGVIIKIIMIS